MDQQDSAKLKAAQTAVAIVSLNNSIKREYYAYRNQNISAFNRKKNSFDIDISNTEKIVNATLKGKTNPALVAVLNQLVRESPNLLNGVNTIILNTNYISDAKDFIENAISGFFSGSPLTNVIELEDDFLDTKIKLNDLIPLLQEAKLKNDNLYDGLDKIFERIVSEVAAFLSELSYPEVKAIAVSQGLHPKDNINLGAVEETDFYIDKTINLIEKTISDIQKAFTDMHNTDDRTADTFGGAKLELLSISINQGNEWTDYMKERNKNKGAILDQYMTDYGLTLYEAELLYRYDVAFVEYAIEHDLSPMEASYQYSMLIASFVYKDEDLFMQAGWKANGGVVISDRKLKKIFTKELGFTEDEYNALDNGVTRNHNPKLYGNGEGKDDNEQVIRPDDIPETVGDYNSRSDLAHTHGAIAIMLKSDIDAQNGYDSIPKPSGGSSLFQPPEPGHMDGFATFHGDIASGSIDQRDARADADAVNIVTRMRESNYADSPVKTMDDYHQEVYVEGRPNQKRMEILEGNFGSEEALKNHIYAEITDLQDLLIQPIKDNDDGTFDDADKMWNYIEGDLSGANDEAQN